MVVSAGGHAFRMNDGRNVGMHVEKNPATKRQEGTANQ